MLIRGSDRPVYVTCSKCMNTFKMGKSCECGSVVTKEIQGGAFVIEETDHDTAVIDTE